MDLHAVKCDGSVSNPLNVIELAILEKIVGLMSDSEIMFSLEINQEQLDIHLETIFAKLNVENKIQATHCAIKRDLIPISL